jgi:hypothetical protein
MHTYVATSDVYVYMYMCVCVDNEEEEYFCNTLSMELTGFW